MMRLMKAFALALVLLASVTFAAGCSGKDGAPENAASYEDLIFDTTRVHTIEVTLSEEDRADQMANPTEKTKYEADVVIDGEEVKDVVFKTKGNSSLFFTVAAGKDKFSYLIDFTASEKDRTFHGLDKLNLQNNFTDAISAKEYMAFWLFRKMGVDAPLASYVWLTVNEEPQGLYTALEYLGDSFLERTAGGEGTLYKPEMSDLDLNDVEMQRLMAGESAAHDNPAGADLIYTDDNEESYPDIFENNATDDDAQTRARVIQSLKALSEKTDLDEYLDTQEIIRYFATHNYLVNYDSYTGAMLHNYYLCEKDGKLAMFPWDYNAAFAATWARINPEQSDATMLGNYGIDTPLLGAKPEQRPMWKWVVDSDSYKEDYHRAMDEFLRTYFESGEFKQETDSVMEMLLPYVEKDPTAFYSAERFTSSSKALCDFCLLRAESIRRQLDGDLSTETQNQLPSDQVDVSMMTIDDLA